MAEGQGANQTISAVATIVQAVAWPAVVALIFLIYRAKIKTLFDVFTHKVDTATHLKAWQLEFATAEREIKEAVNSTDGATVEKEVPAQQVQAARDLNEKLQSSPISDQTTNRVVEQQLKMLSAEYERVRASMKGGSLRRQLMNEIAGKMRALSLAARPLLRGLVASQSAGERLPPTVCCRWRRKRATRTGSSSNCRARIRLSCFFRPHWRYWRRFERSSTRTGIPYRPRSARRSHTLRGTREERPTRARLTCSTKRSSW